MVSTTLFDIEVEEAEAVEAEPWYRRFSNRDWWLLFGGFCVFCILLVVIYLRSPMTNVDKVVVTGSEQVSFEQVLTETGVYKSQMMDVDSLELQRQLEAVPWVWRAEVRRQWPNTVVIDLIERKPAANVLGENGNWQVVDATGRVLTEAATPMPAIPTIDGAGKAGPPGSTLSSTFAPGLEVAGLMPTELALSVSAVMLQPDGTVQLLLPGGQIALLGTPDKVEDKLQALVTVIGRADLSGVSIVDVRVPNAPVLIRPSGAS